ncbi:YhgE/Pip domain-containing protein [Evansella halocellulosilytica]|uniref:YhgE/Pip domain-containing protein n=1 Tax=Evansella halocellulosilytica TaxID=2011013 RepID=UPI00211C5992|nr:YhgE/Pip domain-containing protein [Evansella halocellulosilytica]
MKKKITIAFITMLLVFPYHKGIADSEDESDRKAEESETGTNEAGEIDSKAEVVYGNLSATGDLNSIYVVNMLDVTKPGLIIDHGEYTSIKNLTDLSEIEAVNDSVQLQASRGWFYYQGNIEGAELPWDVDISYMLDGEEISPDDLPGSEGRLHVTLQTSENESANREFYENYTLQISLTLDTEIIRNIQAPDATIANVGKKRQLSFTVMPDRDGDISFLADVVDFEMEGIDISAIPLSMALEDPELDEMTKEMQTLSDAIEEINVGVSDLNTGVTELNDGVQSLNDGSNEYHSGMIEIKDSSSEIIHASEAIDDSLAVLNEEISGSSDEMDLSDLDQLPEGLILLADGLGEVADGLTVLNENFSAAYSALDDAMNGIPASSITEEDMQQLYSAEVDDEVIDHLIEVYVAAQTAKGTYDNIKEAFDAVETALKESSDAVKDMSDELTNIANDLSTSFENMEGLDALSELGEGIAMLSDNYGEFHSGLVSYTDGVSQLADSYEEIDSGINEITQGTSELESGVNELSDGTDELADETSDLPNQMQDEVNTMIDEYDKSDFEPVSFVSSENRNIDSVQFVLKTEAIEMDEEDSALEEEDEDPSFWERLMNLFS